MRRKTILAAAALALMLGGCDSFDPLDKFQDWDIMGSSKKPLQGERRQVFPEGVPGVQQGVPADLVKGYQAPVEPPPQVVEEKKVKPRPKVAARPKPKAQPKTAQPRQQQQQQQQQTAPAAAAWPTPPQQQQNSAAWPTPPQQQQTAWPQQQQQIPGSQPTWPTQAAPPPATR